MKRNRFSRLSAIILTVAMLLPWVMTAPVQAAGAGYDVLWSWDAADHDVVANAAIMKNNIVPRNNHEAIASPVESHYGTYSNRNNNGTIVSASGSEVITLFSMYNGINAKGGLPSVKVGMVEDRERKTTESLTITMNDLGIATDAAAVALSHVLAVRVSISTEMSMLRDDDALYTVTTSAGRSWAVGMRNWTLLGIGTVGTSDALYYQITSENLLGDQSLAEGETIETIVYQPFGEQTGNSRGGWFSMGLAEIRGYDSKAVFESRVEKSTTYTSVSEQTLRDIVIDEADTVANLEWTISEDLNGYSAGGNYDPANYAAGTVFRGPVYQRAASSESDTGLLLTTESFQDLVDNNAYTNRVKGEIVAAPGMDCSTFVYNAISRVSQTAAFTNALYERDNRLVRLFKLPDEAEDHPKFSDTDVFANTDRETVYAAYAQMKPGDVINTYRSQDIGVHACLIYSKPTANQSDLGNSTVTIMEQTSTIYNGSGYKANAQTRTVTFKSLYDSNYVPYTLTEYTEGRVKNANVQFAIVPKAAGNYAGGVDIAVSSNYRLIELSATLSGNGITPVTVSEYGIRSRYESQIMDTTALNEALADLEAGEYTLTVSATTGPKTHVGAAMPVATETVNFTMDSGHEAAHTAGTVLTASTSALADDTYYLDGDVTDAGVMTVTGDVVLCLNGYTLKFKSSLIGNMITLDKNATLTICGGSNGTGCIHGNGASATGIYTKAGAKVTLNSGTITGFNNTSAAGAVYLYNTGKMDMNGGAITNNVGTYGGAVRTASKAVFTMNGGIISGNRASTSGSAIMCAGVVVINGGTVCGNLAQKDKASTSAIYLNGTGRLSMNGGSVVDNDCGGIYFAGTEASAYMNLNGGTITGNNRAMMPDLADVYLKSTIPVAVSNTKLGSWSCGSATPSMTLVSGTFGMDPAQTDWCHIHADSTCRAVGGYWVVGPTACEEHSEGKPLSLTKLAGYSGYKLQCDSVVESGEKLSTFADPATALGQKVQTALAKGYDLVFI